MLMRYICIQRPVLGTVHLIGIHLSFCSCMVWCFLYGYSMIFYYDEIILEKFSVHESLALTLFLLKILYSLCCLGNRWSRRLRKDLAMLVLTCLPYGVLNQIIFQFWLFVFLCFFCALYFRFTFLCPLPFKAFSYSGLAELKSCSLEELLDNLSSIESGRCFIIWGGWFEEVWIYNKLSFGFL